MCSLAVDLEGRLVSAAYDRTIRVWDTASLQETRVLRRHFVKVSPAEQRGSRRGAVVLPLAPPPPA